MQVEEFHIHQGHPIHVAFSATDDAVTLVSRVLPGQTVTKDAAGKPFLSTGDGSLHPLSLTHTPGFSAVCWTAEGQVGMDAEAAGRVVSPALQARMRHPSESDALYASLIDVWIMKESVLKLIGTGLRLGMNKIHLERVDADRFIARWNGQDIHGILFERHGIRLSIAHTSHHLL